LNVARVSPAHGLLAAGGEDGALECFDLRAPVTATRLPGASAGGGAVTCLRFDDSGMTVRSCFILRARWSVVLTLVDRSSLSGPMAAPFCCTTFVQAGRYSRRFVAHAPAVALSRLASEPFVETGPHVRPSDG